jgi:hypothetical protein
MKFNRIYTLTLLLALSAGSHLNADRADAGALRNQIRQLLAKDALANQNEIQKLYGLLVNDGNQSSIYRARNESLGKQIDAAIAAAQANVRARVAQEASQAAAKRAAAAKTKAEQDRLEKEAQNKKLAAEKAQQELRKKQEEEEEAIAQAAQKAREEAEKKAKEEQQAKENREKAEQELKEAQQKAAEAQTETAKQQAEKELKDKEKQERIAQEAEKKAQEEKKKLEEDAQKLAKEEQQLLQKRQKEEEERQQRLAAEQQKIAEQLKQTQEKKEQEKLQKEQAALKKQQDEAATRSAEIKKNLEENELSMLPIDIDPEAKPAKPTKMVNVIVRVPNKAAVNFNKATNTKIENLNIGSDFNASTQNLTLNGNIVDLTKTLGYYTKGATEITFVVQDKPAAVQPATPSIPAIAGGGASALIPMPRTSEKDALLKKLNAAQTKVEQLKQELAQYNKISAMKANIETFKATRKALEEAVSEYLTARKEIINNAPEVAYTDKYNEYTNISSSYNELLAQAESELKQQKASREEKEKKSADLTKSAEESQKRAAARQAAAGKSSMADKAASQLSQQQIDALAGDRAQTFNVPSSESKGTVLKRVLTFKDNSKASYYSKTGSDTWYKLPEFLKAQISYGQGLLDNATQSQKPIAQYNSFTKTLPDWVKETQKIRSSLGELVAAQDTEDMKALKDFAQSADKLNKEISQATEAYNKQLAQDIQNKKAALRSALAAREKTINELGSVESSAAYMDQKEELEKEFASLIKELSEIPSVQAQDLQEFNKKKDELIKKLNELKKSFETSFGS